MYKILLPGIMLLFFAGTCRDRDYGTGFHDLHLNECGEFGVGNYVCFDTVLNDSRCPKGVRCAWAGEAIAGFSLRISGKPVLLTLKVKEDTIIGDYRIEFENLMPYPDISSELDPDDYMARILVRR